MPRILSIAHVQGPGKVSKIDRNGLVRPGSTRAATKRKRTGIILCSLGHSLSIPHPLWSGSPTARLHKARSRPYSCISNCSAPSEQRDAKRISPRTITRFWRNLSPPGTISGPLRRPRRSPRPPRRRAAKLAQHPAPQVEGALASRAAAQMKRTGCGSDPLRPSLSIPHGRLTLRSTARLQLPKTKSIVALCTAALDPPSPPEA